MGLSEEEEDEREGRDVARVGKEGAKTALLLNPECIGMESERASEQAKLVSSGCGTKTITQDRRQHRPSSYTKAWIGILYVIRKRPFVAWEMGGEK